METIAERRVKFRFFHGSYRRVDYHCKLCPENHRASFGDPDQPPGPRRQLGNWFRGVVAHMLVNHATHPQVIAANDNPASVVINEFLVATYS